MSSEEIDKSVSGDDVKANDIEELMQDGHKEKGNQSVPESDSQSAEIRRKRRKRKSKGKKAKAKASLFVLFL